MIPKEQRQSKKQKRNDPEVKTGWWREREKKPKRKNTPVTGQHSNRRDTFNKDHSIIKKNNHYDSSINTLFWLIKGNKMLDELRRLTATQWADGIMGGLIFTAALVLALVWSCDKMLGPRWFIRIYKAFSVLIKQENKEPVRNCYRILGT